MAQQLAQRDAALEAFDRLRLQEVRAAKKDTAFTFLAGFQSTAASLKPEERIKLVVYMHENGLELLKNVLADPRTSKVCALRWVYNGEDDVHSVIPLLINSCPELAMLQVEFRRHSAFDFVSSVLEHPSNKVKVLEMPRYTKGSIPRFFAALNQSQVSALSICSNGSSEFLQGLCDYLARGLLVRFELWMGNKRVPSEVMMLLTRCTCLTQLKLACCEFSESAASIYPSKSITKLVLNGCTFGGGFDWSFLADSDVRELGFYDMGDDVNGTQLGSALAVHLRVKGLDELRLLSCDFVDEVLAGTGVEIGQTKRLILEHNDLNNVSVELIALALQSPSNEIRELVLPYEDRTMSSIETHLALALRHPNCSLVKLSLSAFEQQHIEAARRVEGALRNRRALLVLLQGQQVRRLHCPLRRLPVEMFRMVGEVLL